MIDVDETLERRWGPKIAPESRVDDGAFDVVWSEDVSKVKGLRLIPAVLRGIHLAHPKIYFARTAEVEVFLAKPALAHVDGEILSPTRNFRAGCCRTLCASWSHSLWFGAGNLKLVRCPQAVFVEEAPSPVIEHSQPLRPRFPLNAWLSRDW